MRVHQTRRSVQAASFCWLRAWDHDASPSRSGTRRAFGRVSFSAGHRRRVLSAKHPRLLLAMYDYRYSCTQLPTQLRTCTTTFLTAVAGTAACSQIAPNVPASKAPRIRRTTRSLKPTRSPLPTSATRSKCHNAGFKMRKPTLSAHAAGRHSATVDHAARLPAQRGPWRSHGCHAQLSSPLHAARRHGLGRLIVGAVQLLLTAKEAEARDQKYIFRCAIVAAATLSVGPRAADAVRGRKVFLRLRSHSTGTTLYELRQSTYSIRHTRIGDARSPRSSRTVRHSIVVIANDPLDK